VIVTPLALVLILLSSFCWAGFDLSRKKLIEHVPPVALLFILALAQGMLMVGWLLWDGFAAPEAGFWLPSLGSTALNVGANLAFIFAIAVSPLSVTVPLLSLVPALTALVSMPLLGEVPDAVQMTGILLVVAGALTLNLERFEGLTLRGLLTSLGREKGSLLMLVTAVCWSLALPLDKLALRHGTAPLHSAVQTLGVAVAVLVLALARRELHRLSGLQRSPGWFGVSVVVGTLALAFQMLALPIAWVSLVEVIKRGLGNFLALLTGWWFLGEAITLPKVLAACAMGAGVALVMLA
jgi:drug/metabolite transporter (DMT)-like permease